VVSGSHKNVKKQKKTFFLPEIFVENEETVRQRCSSLVRHSTPYQSSQNQLSDVQSGGFKKECINLDTSVDSGFDDYSIASSINSRSDSINRSEYTQFKTPHARPADSLWESFATPIADFKDHFKSRQSFVDDRVKIKLNFETLVTGCLGVVMFSSIVFSVYMGAHLTKSTQNGKYKSIEYGATKRIQNLKEQGRLIDYDIKDEFGNTLGGKRAAIQFAYEQKYGKEPAKDGTPDIKPDVKAPVDAPVPKRVDNEVRPKVVPKVVEATVEEPVPSIQNNPELGIAELSRKIDELDALLQDDLVASQIEVETATKINRLKERKKKLVEKVKTKPSARPVVKPTTKPVAKPTPAPVVESKPVGKVKSRRAANARAVKTKVQNPLTKSIPEVKQSKPKKVKKNVVKATEAKAAIDASDKNEYPEAEDSFDVDPGLVDYPDDPQFRSPEEF